MTLSLKSAKDPEVFSKYKAAADIINSTVRLSLYIYIYVN